MFFKVKLSDSEIPAERKSHDIDIIKTLFSECCPGEGELDIKTCFRLINKNKPSKDIPIKAVLVSKEQRRHFLLNSKNIVDIDNPDLKCIVIARDLTFDQREINEEIQK